MMKSSLPPTVRPLRRKLHALSAFQLEVLNINIQQVPFQTPALQHVPLVVPVLVVTTSATTSTVSVISNSSTMSLFRNLSMQQPHLNPLCTTSRQPTPSITTFPMMPCRSLTYNLSPVTSACSTSPFEPQFSAAPPVHDPVYQEHIKALFSRLPSLSTTMLLSMFLVVAPVATSAVFHLALLFWITRLPLSLTFQVTLMWVVTLSLLGALASTWAPSTTRKPMTRTSAR